LISVFVSIFAKTKNIIMVVEIEHTASEKEVKDLLERLKNNRSKEKKSNFIEFFGALPDIGDGLEYQKKARNEWV
jgi:glycerophosphoryl diester phosphodiesterase